LKKKKKSLGEGYRGKVTLGGENHGKSRRKWVGSRTIFVGGGQKKHPRNSA